MPTRRTFLSAALAAAPLALLHAGQKPAADESAEKKPAEAQLKAAIALGCSWITDVAQMKSDVLAGETNTHNLIHKHWKGALRGEYSAADRQWGFFCPIWHTGQAIKALVFAAKALNEPQLLDAAVFSAQFIGAERVGDKSHPHYGLIFGFEDRGD